jgi:catechol 2,3-dioxygenase-like lactoylglutathione lyase family enzyme
VNDNSAPAQTTSPIHHVGLTVSDLERSVAFYTTYFGVLSLDWDDTQRMGVR